ncbi:MAG: alanine--tRNA ligase, partial [Phyllobacteriaceae bacterium]|nr:alanine--tRNA ligase [Phyllobacteriaceae bacterium]
GFQAAMARQKAEARASWAGSGEASSAAIWFAIKERVGASEFLGYETETAEGAIVALVRDGAEVAALEAGETGSLVVNQTPFYAESGGQTGDTGVVLGDGFRFVVEDTRKEGEGLFVHVGRVEAGQPTVGAAVRLEVDGVRRRAIRANHSATHILHEALREVLGDHVAQKGSAVDADRLRFDFSHPKPMSAEEIARVEEIANDVVLQNAEVTTRLLSVDDAIASGARALFGEKYGEEVRVVSMGRQTDGNRAGRSFSVELCGGTHVTRTGDIGVVSIVAESAVAAGVRRLEALTARGARRHLVDQDHRVRELAGMLKVQQSDVVERVGVVSEERRKLERDLAEAKKKLAMGGGGATAPAARKIGALDFVGRVVSGISPKDLKGLVDEAKKTIEAGVVTVVGLTEDGKAGVVVGVVGAAASSLSAVELVKIASEAMGGKGGGGRPDMAQAGGPDGGKADAAIEAVAREVAARVA